MARPLRVEIRGAYYHVYSRGNRRESIFFSSRDRKVFLEKLAQELKRHAVLCHAYVLMDNHYHLLLQTPRGNLQRFMHGLNASYSNWFRRKHEITGSVFQGRYKSHLIEGDKYFLAVSAYIHLNPVRKLLVNRPEKYPWSSMRYYVTSVDPPDWLYCHFTWSFFDKDCKNEYREFVYGWMGREGEIFDNVKHGFIVGSEDFAGEIARKVKNKRTLDLREYSSRRTIVKDISPETIIQAVSEFFCVSEEEIFKKCRNNVARKVAIYLLRCKTSLTLREIGELFDMDYAAVSQCARRMGAALSENSKLARQVKKVEKIIKSKSI